jgi:peptide/nickel transport system ATP-binding protein
MAEPKTTTNATPAGAKPAALEAVDLTKHFRLRHRGRTVGVVHACEHVSVALHAGKVTAVVGESGSGKSTLARMLARLIEPTSGRLLLDGKAVDLAKHNPRAYREEVQLVLQDPFASINPVHSVRYTLKRPLQIHKVARRGAALDAALAELLGRVKLTPAEQYLAKLPHELSGGQRQRVSIARALAVRPKVLLADEPVSMLDVSIRLGVLNLLEELRDQDGLALLYVTHDIASARYFADEILVMYAGEVIERGPSTVVTDQPSHPYTQLLLSAAPDPDRANAPVLTATGAPPSLVNPPTGCRFHPRCPHAMPICKQQTPPTVPVGTGQQAACWLHVTQRPKVGATTAASEGTP